jgi:hypothetical protein
MERAVEMRRMATVGAGATGVMTHGAADQVQNPRRPSTGKSSFSEVACLSLVFYLSGGKMKGTIVVEI